MDVQATDIVQTGDSSWNGKTFQRLFEGIEKCDYLPNSIAGHGFKGWFYTSLTPLLTALQDLKVVSIIVSTGAALGQGLISSLVGTLAGLVEVLAKDVNAPGRTISTGPYQIPLAVKNSARGGARDRIIQIANAVDSNGARSYQLDIKLQTLVTKVVFDKSGDVPRATGVEFLEGQRSAYLPLPTYYYRGAKVITTSKYSG